MELRIDKICKKYSDKDAVRDFSIKMDNGVYGLLGENGAGKSTLMKIIVDVLKPTSGNIYVDGLDKNSMGDGYRNLIGYLPQDIVIYKDFTVMDFLLYMAALKGINGREAKNRAEQLLKITNLTENARKKCGKLSGGMKRRLGIAQALLNEPKILILDEPTVGLDPKERIKFRNMISDISRDRIVLISTHIVSDIEYIAKEVIIIKEGKLLNNKTVGELIGIIDNKIWMAKVKPSELDRIESRYVVSNTVQKEQWCEVRIVSDDRPFEGAENVKPNFEEVYLYFFNYRN